MPRNTHGARRCTAKSKRSGTQCRQWAIRGGFVCSMHGGQAPQVKRKAQERLNDLIDPDRALREAANLAYSDITVLYDEKGHLKPMAEWPPEIRGAVAQVETVRRNIDHADGQTAIVIKVKVWDKLRALEMLFKNMGLLTNRIEMKLESDIVARLHEARRRVASTGSRQAQ